MSLKRVLPFAAVMLLYLVFPMSMIWDHENVLEEGQAYRFRPVPIDPNDAFRGRYVTLSFNNLRLPMQNAEEAYSTGQEVYATVGEDSLGFAYFSRIAPVPPDSPNYIKTTIRSMLKDEVVLRTPENMQRFYVNEVVAPEVERRYREMTRNRSNSPDSIAWLAVKVLNGKVISEALYLGGERIGVAE